MVRRKITKSERTRRTLNKAFRKMYPEGMTNNAEKWLSQLKSSPWLNDHTRLRHSIKKSENPFKKAGFHVTSKSIIRELLKYV